MLCPLHVVLAPSSLISPLPVAPSPPPPVGISRYLPVAPSRLHTPKLGARSPLPLVVRRPPHEPPLEERGIVHPIVSTLPLAVALSPLRTLSSQSLVKIRHILPCWTALLPLGSMLRCLNEHPHNFHKSNTGTLQNRCQRPLSCAPGATIDLLACPKYHAPSHESKGPAPLP